MRSTSILAVAACLFFTSLGAHAAEEKDLEGEVKDMTYVGLQMLPDSARVFVRTSDPVKYTIDNSRPGLIVIVLDNTKVPVFNNTRPLIADYFNGPITLIEAKPIEAASPSVRVEIHTRSKYATYKHAQKDTQVNVDFNLK